jgi:hypothetical protein
VTRIGKDSTVVELAGIVSEHLRARGIQAVLSGGALAGIYSEGEYVSKDIDFITSASTRELARALADLGFHKGAGRHFLHPETDIAVEFPHGPVSVGKQIVQHTVLLDTLAGRIAVLSVTDAVKDRLAGFIHWRDQQNLQQARLIAGHHAVDEEAILDWAAEEGAGREALERIRLTLQRARIIRSGVR